MKVLCDEHGVVESVLLESTVTLIDIQVQVMANCCGICHKVLSVSPEYNSPITKAYERVYNMKGYKAFDNDLTCRDYQFTTNETHTFDGTPILCRQGFHFCTTLPDVVKYYNSPNMRVFEIEASGIITGSDDDCSKRACSEIMLIKEISLNEVMLSISKPETAYWWAERIGNRDIMINLINESEWVYWWARYIGNKDIMIDRINESKYAYQWASNIGDIDIMINHITESKYAYWWAMEIGNRDIMINKINDSEWAYYWAREIGNQDIMIDRITESKWAFEWAKNIGNKDVMISKINDSEYAYGWTRDIGNQDIMIDRITESKYAYEWAREIGNQDIMKSRVTEPFWIDRWNINFPSDHVN